MLRVALSALVGTFITLAPAIAQSPDAGDAGAVGAAGASPFGNDTGTRRQLGYGRLFSNDVIGDGQDRWRTGSVTMSRAFGYSWNGTAPGRLFSLFETRVQGQIISPDNLQTVVPGDRPYAGVLSLGLHSHSSHGGYELSLGADLVIIGPQTRLDSLHKSIHDFLGKPEPSNPVLALQIADTIRPTAVAELGRSFELSDSTRIRPYAEARAGDETLLRVGADVTMGSVGIGELFSRESITGQRYRVIYDSGPGTSFVLGGDVAYVSDSVYLPESRGYQIERVRERARAGFHWQGRNASAFYGLTYLGREFKGQAEGQVTGSLRVKLRF